MYTHIEVTWSCLLVALRTASLCSISLRDDSVSITLLVPNGDNDVYLH
jgi:hypothetical protein